MRQLINNLKILCFIIFSLAYSVESAAMSQKQAIEFLKEYSESNRKRIIAIDQQLRDVLMSTYTSDLSPKKASKTNASYSREIEVLTLKRKEHLLREDLIDRMIFVIDRKYRGGDWREFLSKHILEMASIESTSMNADVGFVKFCGYLSAAVKRVPEKSENVFAFLEGYIQFSTILDPRPPSEFIRHRSYTNGTTALYTKGVSAETVGDIVEDRLQKRAYLNSLQRKAFEQRAPILRPVDILVEARNRVEPELLRAQDKAPLASERTVRTEASASVSEQTLNPESNLQLKIKMQDIHKSPKEPAPEPPTVPKSRAYN